MDNVKILDCLKKLNNETHELYLSDNVTVLETPPSPLEFHRDWVAPNVPVIIQGAINHWPALKRWNTDYLRKKIGNKEVTVTVTPNGYADAVHDGKFVMPEERRTNMSAFLNIMDAPHQANGVFYIQKQNSNFTEEFEEIMPDAEAHLPWASEALGKMPDAVNFWLGDKRAVTSMHRDHYENLYSVVSGYKKFLLIPPTQLPFIPYKEYRAAYYHETEEGEFIVKDAEDTNMVPWIPIDPLKPDLDKYPLYSQTRPIEVTVHAGETLYLPSLWFHHVRQSHGCIAVNFWYDMQFDIKYCYYKFLESLVQDQHGEDVAKLESNVLL